MIARHRPDEQVEVEAFRGGRARTFTVRLGEAPINDRVAVAATPEEPEEHTMERLGINLRELTPDLAEQLGFAEPGGVIVLEVEPFGPAARRGMSPRDRIRELNGREIESVDDVRRELDAMEAEQIARFVVDRANGSSQIINIRVPN